MFPLYDLTSHINVIVVCDAYIAVVKVMFYGKKYV